jgi:hypothetical protein
MSRLYVIIQNDQLEGRATSINTILRMVTPPEVDDMSEQIDLMFDPPPLKVKVIIEPKTD